MAPTWQRALVTGASSGIGEAFARQLAAAGSHTVLVARDRERLMALAAELPAPAEVLPADLTDAEQLARVEHRLERGDVDLLVNNAGFGLNGRFLDHGRDDQSGMVMVNVVALHRLCHAAGGAMVAGGRGTILNVASVAAFTAAARSSTYSATKAFVVSFSDALHHELAGTGVTVTALCPGLTRTEFHQRGDYDLSGMPGFAWQEAETVAAQGLRAAADGKRLQVTGLANKVLVGVVRAVPDPLVRAVGYRLLGSRSQRSPSDPDR